MGSCSFSTHVPFGKSTIAWPIVDRVDAVFSCLSGAGQTLITPNAGLSFRVYIHPETEQMFESIIAALPCD